MRDRSTRERNGVRLGQPVRDLDGKRLGRVADLYEWGFAVQRGFRFGFRQESVILYEEVRGERDGALVVARSDRALDELAAGEVPGIWRIPAPPEFPSAATPPEARGVFEELAAEHPRAGAPPGAPGPAPQERPAPVGAKEEREEERPRGEALPPAPP
jgi:hypothetical protein